MLTIHEKIITTIKILFIRITRTKEFNEIIENGSSVVKTETKIEVRGSKSQNWNFLESILICLIS